MKTVLVSCLILLTIATTTRGCDEDTIRKRCPTTNREEYLECVTSVKKLLRCQTSCEGGTDCSGSCDDCNCDSCGDCSPYCDSCCRSCCRTRETCTTESCCRRTCHTNRCRNNPCREVCTRNCSGRPSYQTSSNRTSTDILLNINNSPSNHTSVVHVNNFLTTKNIIATPVKTDVTNLNRLHPANSWGVGLTIPDNGELVPPGRNCCSVLSRRQCVRTDSFPFVRCFHYRYKMCGAMCYAHVMHTYYQQQCQQGGACQQKPVYVPQPDPNCAYSQTWPYFSCGRPQGVNCEGCYGHHFGQERISCNPFCFDEGYGIGPYYRQGPYYQPWYSPVPSCRVTITCQPFSNSYGYQENTFGNYLPGFNVGPFPFASPGSDQILPNQPDIYTVEMATPNSTDTSVPIMQTDNKI